MRGAKQRKAKAFWLKAAQFAGLAISGHLTKRTRSSSTPRSSSSSTSKKTRSDGTKRPTPTQNLNGHSSKSDLVKDVYAKIIKLPGAGETLKLSGDFDPFLLQGKETSSAAMSRLFKVFVVIPPMC